MANKKSNPTITRGAAVASSLKSAFGTVTSESRKVGAAIRDLEGRQRTLAQSIQTFGRMGKNVDGLREKYAAVTAQVEKLRAANERLLAVERARVANQKTQEALRGKIMETAVVGAAIALPTVAEFKRASEFTYQLQVIGNTADLTDAQIKQLGADLLRLSDSTGQSADTLKNAIGFLVA